MRYDKPVTEVSYENVWRRQGGATRQPWNANVTEMRYEKRVTEMRYENVWRWPGGVGVQLDSRESLM